jgi:hypothetical protein
VAAAAATLGGLLATLYGFHSLFIVMFCFSAAGLAISTILLSMKKRWLFP